MDPNKALANLRDIAAKATNTDERLNARPGTEADAVEDLVAMAEAFQSLDGWLSTGGFKPEPWNASSHRLFVARDVPVYVPALAEAGADTAIAEVQVLVTEWEEGKREVALRSESHHTWLAPGELVEEPT